MIAIFSDLHLGIKGDNQHWHSVAVEFIQDMVKTLKEKNIKDVFFLGDWFHNCKNPPVIGGFFYSYISR